MVLLNMHHDLLAVILMHGGNLGFIKFAAYIILLRHFVLGFVEHVRLSPSCVGLLKCSLGSRIRSFSHQHLYFSTFLCYITCRVAGLLVVYAPFGTWNFPGPYLVVFLQFAAFMDTEGLRPPVEYIIFGSCFYGVWCDIM